MLEVHGEFIYFCFATILSLSYLRPIYKHRDKSYLSVHQKNLVKISSHLLSLNLKKGVILKMLKLDANIDEISAKILQIKIRH